MPNPGSPFAVDGTVDFSGGVDSVKTRTIASEANPNGLRRNQLSWMCNCTVRDGGITQRAGIIKVGNVVEGGDYLFQGKFTYQPIDGSDPYEIWSVTGRILRVNLTDASAIDLSAQFGLTNSTTEPVAYFCQADQFLVIQSGDNTTPPLFWDGATLRRSNGLTGISGGQPTSVWNLNPASFWVVPPVGGNVLIPLNNEYLGANLDVGTYGVIGTFTVIAHTAAVPYSITIQTVASEYIGRNIGPPGADVPFTVNPAPIPANVNEIPPATAMAYYAGRLWYARGRVVSAGDIIYGESGTLAYNFRDSILRVTENPLALEGDGFEVASQDGSVRAIKVGAAIDASLGQGRLFLFTSKAVYALQVPVSRDDWISADGNNQPLMTVVQLNNGSVNDRGVVPVNGDLYYQSLEPSIRSLDQSMRFFSQPGNRSLSSNEQRILQLNDRALMYACNGIYFNNRLLQTALPRETPSGIVHDALVPLDFVPISSFDQQRTPNWEGHYNSSPIYQVSTVEVGGLERAYATAQGSDGSLQLWEITQNERFDYSRVSSDGHRVEWYFETPAYTWANTIGETEFKKLIGAELWVDRLFGTVIFTMEYRPDGVTCWIPWITWQECSPKNTAETVGLPDGYPVDLTECYKATMILPKPQPGCAPCNNARPSNIGLQFQVKLSIKGFCRVRGIWLLAEPVLRGAYQPKLVC